MLHSKYRGADRTENAVLLLFHACMLRTLPSNAQAIHVTILLLVLMIFDN
jgi:hypothetical protein